MRKEFMRPQVGLSSADFLGGGTVWLPLPLREGWGEGLSANCNHNFAAGFSPQSVQRFFAASRALKNWVVALLDDGLKPGESFQALTR